MFAVAGFHHLWLNTGKHLCNTHRWGVAIVWVWWGLGRSTSVMLTFCLFMNFSESWNIWTFLENDEKIASGGRRRLPKRKGGMLLTFTRYFEIFAAKCPLQDRTKMRVIKVMKWGSIKALVSRKKVFPWEIFLGQQFHAVRNCTNIVKNVLFQIPNRNSSFLYFVASRKSENVCAISFYVTLPVSF